MAGAGYKLFNTGDVLTAAQVNTYLQEQAVMRFATTTARDTALSGVLAEGMICYIDADNNIYKYTGSAWVNIDTTGGGSPLTTKGDLYTYSTTDARLGVGNNGETLLADSAASQGLRWTARPSASNPVINSAFQVWQRGTSFTANTGYTADRWYKSAAAGRTFSRQTTSDTTNLPNIQYAMRMQRDSGNTATDNVVLSQSFETANAYPYIGKTVTISFYARAGSNYSAASGNFISRLYTGTGTDQNVEVSYTGSSAVINQASTLTTTWQRFSYSGTIGTTATEFALWFAFTPVGTAGAADYAEITGVQIDIGSVALPFRTYANTLAGELAACQRYYQKSYGQGVAVPTNSTANGIIGFSNTSTGTECYYGHIEFKVTMRAAPTVTTYSFTSSTTNVVSRKSDGQDQGTDSGVPIQINDSGFNLSNNTPGTISTASGAVIHYAASAEL